MSTLAHQRVSFAPSAIVEPITRDHRPPPVTFDAMNLENDGQGNFPIQTHSPITPLFSKLLHFKDQNHDISIPPKVLSRSQSRRLKARYSTSFRNLSRTESKALRQQLKESQAANLSLATSSKQLPRVEELHITNAPSRPRGKFIEDVDDALRPARQTDEITRKPILLHSTPELTPLQIQIQTQPSAKEPIIIYLPPTPFELSQQELAQNLQPHPQPPPTTPKYKKATIATLAPLSYLTQITATAASPTTPTIPRKPLPKKLLKKQPYQLTHKTSDISIIDIDTGLKCPASPLPKHAVTPVPVAGSMSMATYAAGRAYSVFPAEQRGDRGISEGREEGMGMRETLPLTWVPSYGSAGEERRLSVQGHERFGGVRRRKRSLGWGMGMGGVKGKIGVGGRGCAVM